MAVYAYLCGIMEMYQEIANGNKRRLLKSNTAHSIGQESFLKNIKLKTKQKQIKQKQQQRIIIR